MALRSTNRSLILLVVFELATHLGCGTERVIGINMGGNGGEVNSRGGVNSGTGAGAGSPGHNPAIPLGGNTSSGSIPFIGSTRAGDVTVGGNTSSGGISSIGGTRAGDVTVGGNTSSGGSPTSGGEAGSAGTTGTDPLAQACSDSGGTVTSALCCAGLTRDFPNLCSIGACGCGPSSSKTVLVCDCGSNRCWDGQSCAAR